MPRNKKNVLKSSKKRHRLHKAYFADVVAVAVPQVADGLSAGELQALATEGKSEQKGNITMFAGYKTYFVATVMFGLGVAMLLGLPVPEEVWMMLGAVGLGTLRSAVEGAKEEVKDKVEEVK